MRLIAGIILAALSSAAIAQNVPSNPATFSPILFSFGTATCEAKQAPLIQIGDGLTDIFVRKIVANFSISRQAAGSATFPGLRQSLLTFRWAGSQNNLPATLVGAAAPPTYAAIVGGLRRIALKQTGDNVFAVEDTILSKTTRVPNGQIITSITSSAINPDGSGQPLASVECPKADVEATISWSYN